MVETIEMIYAARSGQRGPAPRSARRATIGTSSTGDVEEGMPAER
jgi:hypothetical protein